MSRFKSVVFDVDSTLSGIEGIDWLAALRGSETRAWSAMLTEKAMQGEIPIEAVYSERMQKVRPNKVEIEQLGREYVERIAPRAREALAELRGHGIGVAMVSGGLREAILPLARELGVDERSVYAVSVFFDEEGKYAGFDERSLLTQQNGKRITVLEMGLESPILAVGDGMTDCEVKPVVESFAAFTGFTRRAPVIACADFVIENFDELTELVLE